jgi:hypothetical protein
MHVLFASNKHKIDHEICTLLGLDAAQSGAKNNPNFGQITGIQEKMDTTCK